MVLTKAWCGRRKRARCYSYRPLMLVLEDRTLLSFITAASYAVGFNPHSLALADFNGDGVPDLAVANSGSASVSVLLGNGDGTFQAARNFAVGSNPQSLAVGSFSGGGIVDLSVADAGFNSVSVLLGNGNGTFQGARNFAVGTSPHSLCVGK